MSRSFIYFDLTQRARNCLNDFGEKRGYLETKERVAEAIRAGTFRPGTVRNLGEKTFVEICKWAGVESPAGGGACCPHCGGFLNLKVTVVR
jgi:hypothetical protein